MKVLVVLLVVVAHTLCVSASRGGLRRRLCALGRACVCLSTGPGTVVSILSSLACGNAQYNPTWHCVVGRNFGSYVTHETKHFIYFYLGQVAILLFKSG